MAEREKQCNLRNEDVGGIVVDDDDDEYTGGTRFHEIDLWNHHHHYLEMVMMDKSNNDRLLVPEYKRIENAEMFDCAMRRQSPDDVLNFWAKQQQQQSPDSVTNSHDARNSLRDTTTLQSTRIVGKRQRHADSVYPSPYTQQQQQELGITTNTTTTTSERHTFYKTRSIARGKMMMDGDATTTISSILSGNLFSQHQDDNGD